MEEYRAGVLWRPWMARVYGVLPVTLGGMRADQVDEMLRDAEAAALIERAGAGDGAEG